MEEILKQLQAIQIEAFKMKVPHFNITTYHWEDTPGSPDVIFVFVSKGDQAGDGLHGDFYRDTAPEKAESIINQLKIYIGL